MPEEKATLSIDPAARICDCRALPGGPPPILMDMSETGDKRRRRDLDLFVLALIDRGLTTPYALQQGAGLSPGATIPALRRLLEAKVVVQGGSGPRGRVEHKITADGRRHLKNGWREVLADGPSGDLEADLRVALLVLCLGGDRRLAIGFLRQSAAQTRVAAQTFEEPDHSAHVPALALWYRRLRSVAAKATARGRSVSALAIAKALPSASAVEQMPGRPKRNDKTLS